MEIVILIVVSVGFTVLWKGQREIHAALREKESAKVSAEGAPLVERPGRAFLRERLAARRKGAH